MSHSSAFHSKLRRWVIYSIASGRHPSEQVTTQPTAMPNSHVNPMRELAAALGTPYKPEPQWWAVTFGISLVPPGLAFIVGLLLTNTWQTVFFTLAGAIAAVELAGPYARFVGALVEQFKPYAESGYPTARRALRRYLTFNFSRTTSIGFRHVGHRRMALPLERFRYRVRYRQWTRYFTPFDSQLYIEGLPVGPAALAKDSPLFLSRLWKARQRRILHLIARDLVRADGRKASADCVKTLACALSVPYSPPRVRNSV